ncbi:tetratricopeptide repeat protein [Maribellus maritimus]|uniref:tetratricopeptide repeat protein n=1 Tax=Maribellus maritimus TaxID=2870838 RepID=UPI001EEA83DA|nr:hypothetical protein [Maribellus maritimus]MCG6187506.1 hypothetical protein [Maribellus maritimus]
MKLKIIIISVFSLFVYSFSVAQTIDETYDFANQQFRLGNYQKALVEFQRVAFFDSQDKYNDVYQKIGDSFFALNDYNMAAQNYSVAIRIAQTDSLQIELIFKKTNCFFKQKNFLLALNELFVISEPESAYLKNKYHLYLATSYFGIGDYNSALNYFGELIPRQMSEELAEIFEDFENYNQRFRPDKIKTMSMLLPGLGQFYTGNILKGLNSFVLIGGIAVATVFIWQAYGFLNAFLSTSSWYYRYYTGGYKHAKDLAVHKLEHKREVVYQSVLQLIEENIDKVK